MLERKEPSVTIFRGDDTGGQLGKTIIINFHCGDTVNMEGVIVTFILGGFYEKEFHNVHDGDRLEIFMTHEQTAMLPLGVSFGKLYGTDASGKIRTFSNRIPIRVTNHVCEAYGSAEESGIDVTISNAITWDSIFGKPETFPPSEHRHQKSDIDDLENNLQTLSDGVESAIEAAEAAKTEAEKGVRTVNGKVGDVSLGANDVGAYTKAETDATVARIDADIENASAAADAALTKAENAQSEANAAQTAANVAQSSANEAHSVASVASDKADAAYAELANKLDKTAVVAPSASATAGQAADAKAVNNALAGKVDSQNGVVKNSLAVSSGGLKTTFQGDSILCEVFDGVGVSLVIMHLPQKNGKFALISDIEDAVKDKVGSFESVGGASATVENGVAKLSDFFTESNSLLTATIDARLPYPLYAVPSTGLLKDRAINTTSLASVTVPDNFTDLLIRASVASSLSVTMPEAIATKYGDTFPGEAGEYLITITKTGAAEAYVRTIKLEVANA